jgi:hypothetical protein
LAFMALPGVFGNIRLRPFTHIRFRNAFALFHNIQYLCNIYKTMCSVVEQSTFTEKKEETVGEIQRSPRLLSGAQGAALSRLFWTEPTTTIRVAKDGRSINFIFKVHIRDETRRKPFDLYRSRFLEQPAQDFEKELELALDKTLSGKKPVRRHISNFLRRVCVNAFETWVGESWERGRDRNNQTKERELKDFKQHAKIKTGPQPNAAGAVKVFRLYEQYRELIKGLRSRIKQIRKDKDLLVEVKKSIPVESIRSALSSVSGEANLQLLKNRDVSTATLARAITESELPRSYFAKISFRKYVALGKQLSRDKLWQ